MTEKEKLYLKAKHEYYIGTPIMLDSEFDKLEEELSSMKSIYVNYVGSENVRNNIKHMTSMLSLKKISNDRAEQFFNWYKSVDSPTVLEITPKYDGNAVKLIYTNGYFERALTRGDGEYGQDITMKLLDLVPMRIEGTSSLQVIGEVLMPLDIFNKKYAKDFKNPRNLVAGILSQKENNKEMLQDLHFVPYDVLYLYENEWKYYSNIESYLKLNKFKNLPDIKLVTEFGRGNSKDLFNRIYDEYVMKRAESNYQLDGFVIKVFNGEDRIKIGTNNHHPKWAVAIKFDAIEVSTIIKDIVWEIGKSGVFTPVAILEPIELDGSVITKCTLYNYANVLNNRIGIGAKVSIKKSGDIIPIVSEVLECVEYNNVLKECPYCGNKLEISDTIKCNNKECTGLKNKLLTRHIELLDLDGFGPKTIEKLYDAGIHHIMYLFSNQHFTREILESNGFKGKTLDKILSEVLSIKQIDLWKIIMFHGIPNLGVTYAKEFAKHYVGQEYNFHGFEKKVINDYLNSKVFIDERILYFKKIGIEVILPETKKTNTNSKIYKIEMTGSPKIYGFDTKNDFVEKYKDNLEVVKLSKETDYLIAESLDDCSSKMLKAKKLGVSIITYNDFKMIVEK